MRQSYPKFLLAVVLLMGGCGFGYTRALFITTTNIGLEVTAEPPTFELDIARQEGVIAPQFAGGKKLPMLASFRFKSDGLFSPSLGSAFATGDAAIAMASLYADPTVGPTWLERRKIVRDGGADSTLKLKALPVLPTSWFAKPSFQKTDVRPVFFGTDTSLGIKVAWSGTTGGMPDTLRFGYGRKEVASVPITLETTASNENLIKMASLLATVDTALSVGAIGSDENADANAVDFGYVQYFATGEAATLLALQEDVRKAMIARTEPYRKELAERFGAILSDRGEPSLRAFIVIAHIYNGLKQLAQNDGVAAGHVVALDRLERLVPDKFVAFRRPGGVVQRVEVDATTLRPGGKGDFNTFNLYLTRLRSSIIVLNTALAKDTFDLLPQGSTTPVVVDATNPMRATLTEVRALQVMMRESAASAFTQDSGAAAAISYYCDVLVKKTSENKKNG